MKKISLIIEIHQPIGLRAYRFSETGDNHYYYDDYVNELTIRKTSAESYQPLNMLLRDIIRKSGGKFKISFLFSGITLDLMELYDPEMIQSFKSLINSGNIELLQGSYSNTFGIPASAMEFKRQVYLQKKRVEVLFSKKTVAFSTNLFNHDPSYAGIRFLNRNIKSDDITLLFVPYRISGDAQNNKEDLFGFLQSLADRIYSEPDIVFVNPSEISDDFPSILSTGHSEPVAGNNLDTVSASWNDLQYDAFQKLKSLNEKVDLCNDPVINRDWLYLQSCDHFYYMNTDLYEDNDTGRSYLPYDSPYFAYLNYMNILDDFYDRLTRSIAIPVLTR